MTTTTGEAYEYDLQFFMYVGFWTIGVCINVLASMHTAVAIYHLHARTTAWWSYRTEIGDSHLQACRSTVFLDMVIITILLGH